MNDSFNPYQAPLSQVGDNTPAETDKAPYFTTGTVKLVTMSVCTLGIYHIYWFYQNWKLIAARSPKKMTPWARALFAIFYCHACFKMISESAKSLTIKTKFSAGLAAVSYIVMQLSSRLPNPYMAVCLLSFIPIVMANSLAIQINNATTEGLNQNNRIEGWNWLALVVGGPFFLLALAGIFFEHQSP